MIPIDAQTMREVAPQFSGGGEDAKDWSGILPNTGKYLVVVGPTYGNATYTLKVAIH
jgi:hypothetical protein